MVGRLGRIRWVPARYASSRKQPSSRERRECTCSAAAEWLTLSTALTVACTASRLRRRVCMRCAHALLPSSPRPSAFQSPSSLSDGLLPYLR
jgi:hypothetical protein